MLSKLRKLIGTRAFYAMVIAVVVPIIVQNAITNFVNLLDNLMVGRIGTDQMSGVAIANQLIFVFNLTIFGAISGAGIFTAQYHGAGNTDGVRASHRYKVYICAMVLVIACVLFLTMGRQLVSLYLTDTSDPVRVQNTLNYAMEYLHVMLLGLAPFAIAQSYSSTLRETGETAMPMYAGIIAVAVNLVFNYLLIFGKFGFPCLGVKGAAYATVLSRYVELIFIVVYSHTHTRKHPFAKNLYRVLSIPRAVVVEITRTGTPLLVNELLWSMGMATLNQIYTLRGLDVVAASNISSTVYNLFSVAFMAMGTASAIIVGQSLGASKPETARTDAGKLTAFAVMISLGVGIVLYGFAALIPLLYNTTASVQTLATQLIRVTCCMMPFVAISHCSYFIMRSGGKTIITFLFDCVFTWAVNIPVAYLLAHFTGLHVVLVFLCVQALEIPKCIVGATLIHKGVWIQNLVSDL